MEIKEKILKKAFRLFIERGFFEVYITDIVKELELDKTDVYDYFKTKDELINEVIEEFWFPHLEDIIVVADNKEESSKNKLLEIFQKYSEMQSYLKVNFNISKFNYKSVVFLTSELLKNYVAIPNLLTKFNNRLLEKIEDVIEEGKQFGEILSTVNSKSAAVKILASLQSNIALWGMNQKIDVNLLFQTSFKHLWNNIKSNESDLMNMIH